MKNYDAVIIGFGKGGKTLASELSKHGKKVAVIEKSPKMYGGTCINIACIPTKSLVHSADKKQYSTASKEEFYTKAIAQKDELTSFLRNKNFHMLDDQENITVITGEATFLSDNKVQVKTSEEQFEVTAKQFFLNTGARPNIPPINGLEEAYHIYDSTTLQEREELPEKLIIIGGGYIGLEFASMYANFGSEVTIIDGNEEFLPKEDRDIAEEAKKILEMKNIKIVTKSKVESVKNEEDGVVVTYTENNNSTKVFGNVVLLATGRKPNIENLGLENTTVKVNDRGAVVVDDALKTTANNIWALGDVNGGPQFTYISLDDYRIVKNQLFGGGSYTKKKRGNIPYSVFIDPVLSHIGLNENMAKEKGIAYKVVSMPAAGIPRARIVEQTNGLLKALIDPESNEILGCTLFCVESSEMINIVKLAMEAKLPYTFLRDMVFTHPTMSESLNDLFSKVE
ncbi:FAD-containing oxidoreductase [Psychrobacillus sp. FJAT-51614]|uniref:FAD-containing oxidoreductase n=1 Tax=Psychrobacillus mangrovi TaxID=3117745 RepID=A0ABU8FAZ6_9BACI